MRRALQLAASFRTHPNPRVGAVMLDAQGQVVGEGSHPGPGRPHAERLALDAAGDAARGGTLVVTLEPCDHTGRTPPCTHAILERGVARVVVGAEDPDERVRGAGIRRLRGSGVEVELWGRPEEAEAVDPGYFHHRRTGRARVRLKAASTLDGQVAAADGTSQWITSEEARLDAHRLRAEADAVMIGAGTLRSDDPRLDVRLPDHLGPQPKPVVVAGAQPLPTQAKLWDREPLVFAPRAIEPPAGQLVQLAEGSDGVDLEAALVELGNRGLLDVLVEGGPRLAGALWRAGLVDEGVSYLGAVVAGGSADSPFSGVFATLGDARPVEIVDVRRVGPDLRVTWRS